MPPCPCSPVISQAAQAVQLEAEGVFLFTDVDYLYTVRCLMVGLSIPLFLDLLWLAPHVPLSPHLRFAAASVACHD